jgi:hypothetical protein
MIRKISAYIQLLMVVAVFIALLQPNKLYSPYVITIFLIIWGANNVRAWCMKEEFGIAALVNIPANAPKFIRFLGVLFSIFVLCIGLAGLIEQATT